MFKEVIHDREIPPNFLNSILTNPSLYEMFKNNFEENTEYFQGIDKEQYLSSMLEFIESELFTGNLFHLYSDDVENVPENKLVYIKNFYDDFLLSEFKSNPENILKTRIFKGLEYARKYDKYASKIEEFNRLYDYVFHESIDYFGIVEVLIKNALDELSNGEVSIKDFDILCNYVKNSIDEVIDMDIITKMLYNHAHKINRIFDIEVAKAIVSSVIKDYLSNFGIDVTVLFVEVTSSGELGEHDIENKTISLDDGLLEKFVLLNYVELFERAFLEAELLKTKNLLQEKKNDISTLRTLMDIVVNDEDPENVLKGNIESTEYYNDFLATNFIRTLRFFASCGVDLFENYNRSHTRDFDLEDPEKLVFSKKDISLDQRFDSKFLKYENRDRVMKEYPVIKIFYDNTGKRKRTIELIKKLLNTSDRDLLIEYLHTRIISPEDMIDDVAGLASYHAKIEENRVFIENEIKYIITDSFYYSLESFIKLNSSTRLNIEEYLEDLRLKVMCLPDTPITHKFIDRALIDIEEAQQNI